MGIHLNKDKNQNECAKISRDNVNLILRYFLLSHDESEKNKIIEEYNKVPVKEESVKDSLPTKESEAKTSKPH